MDTNPPKTVFVVEDDDNILNLLSAYLESTGYEVVTAADGESALQIALSREFDICIFDVMLPGKPGTEIASALREAGSRTPVLFLTALGSEADILRGFGAGADDYVIKPFSPRELMVRIEAILRRSSSHKPDQESMLEIGPIQIDEAYHNCRVNGAAVELTPHEYRILRQLMGRPNRVFERGSLIACIYGNETAVSPKAVDVHIHNLRTKLGDKVGDMIQTVRGFGYKLSPDLDKFDSDDRFKTA